MSDRTLRLSRDELWRLLELVDPVELVAARLGGAACGDEAGRLSAAGASGGDHVVFEDRDTAVRCLLPASALRGLRTASVVALAARALLFPSLVTVAVLGSDPATQLQLALIARYVPGVSFVAVWPDDGQPLDERVLDLLDRTDISLLTAGDAGEAMFGASLLVGVGLDRLPARRPAPGAVLVNATGRDLPANLENTADGIYVDDLGLLGDNRHRRFVRVHTDRNDRDSEPHWRAEGWHRNQGRSQVQGDLGQVLTGACPGRTTIDEVLLVELLGLRDLDVTLACRFHRAALQDGAGAWLSE
ncbi:hypothetical protein [Actinocrispum sp. NPDC049592]|uniref:hypothetical protein n=1 Tax=Actinocrispum sp. NPDC049592 TaxID=3154835 RepID=UPI00344961C9